jgi:hypothetical protein
VSVITTNVIRSFIGKLSRVRGRRPSQRLKKILQHDLSRNVIYRAARISASGARSAAGLVGGQILTVQRDIDPAGLKCLGKLLAAPR